MVHEGGLAKAWGRGLFPRSVRSRPSAGLSSAARISCRWAPRPTTSPGTSRCCSPARRWPSCSTSSAPSSPPTTTMPTPASSLTNDPTNSRPDPQTHESVAGPRTAGPRTADPPTRSVPCLSPMTDLNGGPAPAAGLLRGWDHVELWVAMPPPRPSSSVPPSASPSVPMPAPRPAPWTGRRTCLTRARSGSW